MDATLIIPTHNRQEALLETLRALEAVAPPPGGLEVLVVDDGSSDGTASAVQVWARRGSLAARCLVQPNRGAAAARNLGARQAQGKTLLFIDNDIVVGSDFVTLHLHTLREHPGCWVIGRTVHPEQVRATPFGRYRDRRWEAFHESQLSDRVSETDGMTAANLSLPASDFLRLGGFDESYTIASCEDFELGLRARRAGIQVLYNPAIRAVHNDWAVTLERYCERQYMYSISDVRLAMQYGDSSPRAHLVRVNSPVRWRRDGPRVVLKKTLKRLIGSAPARPLLHLCCHALERIVPDTALCERAYDVAVGAAIQRGVRKGLRVLSTLEPC
jgi:GT2 family glycosyltransferase